MMQYNKGQVHLSNLIKQIRREANQLESNQQIRLYRNAYSSFLSQDPALLPSGSNALLQTSVPVEKLRNNYTCTQHY